jgi:acetyl-CoA carboxylase biotin carboxyl carrier protein
MKAKEIQDLIDFIAKSGLDEVNIETDSFKISVKKYSSIIAQVEPTKAQNSVNTVLNNVLPSNEFSEAVQNHISTTTNPPKNESQYLTIKSPMIGTFYRSANPESPVFANVGDDIKSGQVVCIIEAMKLFNEIESECSGKIVKVLVENATPVEYDQPLFLIDPDA